MTDPAERAVPLGAGFASFTEADWRALVVKSTHGRQSEELASESDDGIAVGALYVPDSSGGIVARTHPGAWQVVQRIDLPEIDDARRQIVEDVAGGATGIELVFAGSPLARAGAGLSAAAPRTLDGLAALLRQNAVPTRVAAGEATAAITAGLARQLSPGGVGGSAPSLTAAFDPIATMAVQGGLRRAFADIASEIADLCSEFERAGLAGTVIAADGRLWHAGGASEVQELAAALAAYAAWLRLFDANGIDPTHAAARIGLVLAADADQFLTIAKFRAGRLLVSRILEAAGVKPTATIHAETAWRMMSRHDVHTNMLRTATASLAAGLGGANSVTVLPFDSAARLSDGFARRVARNSQAILMEEAGLAQVADPGAGSGAVEALTERLAERAWDQFRKIESEGGLLAAVRAGSLQRSVAAMRETRLRRVAIREISLTGINRFPVIASAPPATPAPPTAAVAAAFVETADALVLTRLTESFEALRDRADHLAAMGRRPTIFLATLGRPAEYAATVSEIQQIFASGGVAATINPAPASPEAIGTAFAESGAVAACICPAPKVGEAEVIAAAAALKARGAILIGLAGHGGSTPAGIDFRLEQGMNVVEILCNFLERIAAEGQESPRPQ